MTVCAPQHQVELDAALLRVVEHLISGTTRVVKFDHVRHVKVGNTPGTDFARFTQTLECLDRLGQRVLTGPVQQVQIDVVGVHAPQAGLACGRNTGVAGVVRVDLADHEYLVPLSGNGLPDNFLGSAIGVHLGGVDQGQALFDTEAQAGDFCRALMPFFTHVPGALTQHWYGSACQFQCAHVTPCNLISS